MEILFWCLLALVAVAVLAVLTAAVCFFMVFYFPKRKASDEYPIPKGKIYEPFHEQMIEWIRQARTLPHTDVSVTSYDGLTLRGRYYEHKKGGPIEIMFHGYRGNSEQDLSGGVFRCRSLGHNALVVDQRGAGRSDGHVVTFGIKESRDCLAWTEFVLQNIAPDADIILTGISMGAATVLTASSFDLPSNVIGVLADCGYTSARDIICKVIRDDIKLPAKFFYPFVRLGALLFGGFDPDARSPIQSMKQCRVPVMFFHGDTDAFVPHWMSEKNYHACVAEHKRLVLTPNAGHGLCFPVDPDTYLAEMKAFFTPIYKNSKTEK